MNSRETAHTLKIITELSKYLFYCFTVDLRGVPEKTTAVKMFNIACRNLIGLVFGIGKGVAVQIILVHTVP